MEDAAALPQIYLDRAKQAGLQLREDSLHGFQDLVPQAKKLIDDDRIRFVFLHFVTPHPPGIYDRTTHKLRGGGDYLDNLVLADDLLGDLTNEIGKTPSADETTIIVSSDHSWRILLWKTAAFWTPEEERVSGGRFDDRPVLLVHFPHQQTEDDVTASEPELVVHDMIAQMIDGKMENARDVDRFLNTTEAKK